MKLLISAIGRIGRESEYALEAHYLKQARLLARASGLWTAIECSEMLESRASTAVLRRNEEAKLLLANCKNSVCIALDPQGQDVSSVDLMHLIQKQREMGTKSLAFIIGGPDGLTRDFIQNCSGSIRFGSQIWPHKLVRVMLSEQLYRSATLAANIPYSR